MSKAVAKRRVVHLIDKTNWDLFELFKDNVVGGPSIVFHRYHEEGKTKIWEREFARWLSPVKIILGLGANSRYLYCIMGWLPVSKPMRRLVRTILFPKMWLKA